MQVTLNTAGCIITISYEQETRGKSNSSKHLSCHWWKFINRRSSCLTEAFCAKQAVPVFSDRSAGMSWYWLRDAETLGHSSDWTLNEVSAIMVPICPCSMILYNYWVPMLSTISQFQFLAITSTCLLVVFVFSLKFSDGLHILVLDRTSCWLFLTCTKRCNSATNSITLVAFRQRRCG